MFLGQIFAKNAKNDPKTLLKHRNRSKNKIRKISVKSRIDVKSACFFLFFYTYNDILNNAEAINIEVMMRMLKILWKETERKRVVEN